MLQRETVENARAKPAAAAVVDEEPVPVEMSVAALAERVQRDRQARAAADAGQDR